MNLYDQRNHSVVALIAFGMISLFSGCGNINANCTSLPSGLVSWWDGGKISGSTALDIGGSNLGSLLNVASVASSSGNTFLFPSYGGSLIVPNSSSLSSISSGLSVSVWLQGSTGNLFSSSRTLVSKGSRYATMGASSFSFFDTTTINPSSRGYIGAVYDGRYTYFVPYHAGSGNWDGVVTRYDTTLDFSSASSWSYFNTVGLSSGARGYNGAVFDGRYIYLIPYSNAGLASTYMTRYDTNSKFTSSSSWTVFDTSSLNSNAKGFADGTFDGRYVYFSSNLSSWMARYDSTSSSFSSSAAWSFLNVSGVNPTITTTYGGASDGKYLYFSAGGSKLLQYDKSNSFSSTSSWTSFDLSTINASFSSVGVSGFDGKYIYASGPSNLMARFDTSQSLTSAASWTFFDASTTGLGTVSFGSWIFDGTYFYMVPNGSTATLARLDSTQSFSSNSAWSTFDISSLNTNTSTNLGGTFDGRYVYLAKFGTWNSESGTITRYDTFGNQMSFDLKGSVVVSDGLSFSSLGPTLLLNTSVGTYQININSALDSNLHLLTATYDGTTLAFYEDGQLANSQSAQGFLLQNGSPLTIGTTNLSNTSFGGDIQGVQIYNRALNATEVQYLHVGQFCK